MSSFGSDCDWQNACGTLPVGGATILKIAPSEPHRSCGIRGRDGALRGYAV